MTLTLVRNDKPRKAGRSVIFNIEGRTASVAFPKSVFGANVPENIVVEGDFSEPKAPRVPETKEERKARLAALPKLTLAEKIAKREAALEKMRAKLAADAAKASGASAAA